MTNSQLHMAPVIFCVCVLINPSNRVNNLLVSPMNLVRL